MNARRRTLVLGASLIAIMLQNLILAAPAFPCHQNPSGCHSVDAGEIRWEDHTKWDDARIWAQNRWNGLEPITIVKDDAWHVNDLDWGDFNDKYNPAAGYWQYRSGTGEEDYIRLNDYHLNSYTTAKRRHVATHELGHALGIAEFTESTWSGQIMYKTVNSETYLQSHDKTDYHERWGH